MWCLNAVVKNDRYQSDQEIELSSDATFLRSLHLANYDNSKENYRSALYAYKALTEDAPEYIAVAAAFQLGKIYGQKGHPYCCPRLAYEYMKMAAQGGHVQGHYEFALICLSDAHVCRDFDQGARHLTEAAEHDHPDACYRLGMLFCYGHDTYRFHLDIDEAVIYFSKAVEAEIYPAYFELGKIYSQTNSPQFDSGQAYRHLRAAAEAGIVEAQYAFGLLCHREEFIGAEFDRGVDMLVSAADRGHIDACYQVGLLYLHENLLPLFFINNLMAEKYLQKSADGGHITATFELAKLHENRPRLIRRSKKIVRYYKVAVKNEYPGAAHKLANYYRSKNRIALAVKYLKISSLERNVDACLELAELYAMKLGGQENVDKAEIYLVMAAKMGNAKAALKLADTYRKKAVEEEQSEFHAVANSYYEQAITNGYPPEFVQMHLRSLEWNRDEDRGVLFYHSAKLWQTRDLQKFMKLLKGALEAGSEMAKQELEQVRGEWKLQ